jgi:hypothetical protein
MISKEMGRTQTLPPPPKKKYGAGEEVDPLPETLACAFLCTRFPHSYHSYPPPAKKKTGQKKGGWGARIQQEGCGAAFKVWGGMKAEKRTKKRRGGKQVWWVRLIQVVLQWMRQYAFCVCV